MKSRPWGCGIGLLALATGLWAAPSAHIPAAFSADFVQTHRLPGFRTPLVSYGVLRFDPAQGFRWEITAPYHYLFEINGAHAQEQLPDGTLRKLNPEQTPWLAAVERIFVAALSGDESKLQQYFDMSVQPLAHGRRITLTPKPGPLSDAIARIQVLESAPGRPRQLDIREVSGGSMQIRFTPLPPSAVTP